MNHRLEQADVNTIQCLTGGIIYIPIPASGSELNYAGLLYVDLPATVRSGQVFNISVRQITNTFAEQPEPPHIMSRLNVAAATASSTIEWRCVLGAFQFSIPIRTKEVLLEPERRLLSVFRWIEQAIPQDNRRYYVFKRYTYQLANRVDAFGGDSSKVKASPLGEWQEIKPKQCAALAFTIAALLDLLVIILGVFGCGWSVTVIVGLLIGVSYFWVNNCQPNQCNLLRTFVTGVGLGATVLAILLLLGISTSQLVTIFALSTVTTGLAAFVGWVKKCF